MVKAEMIFAYQIGETLKYPTIFFLIQSKLWEKYSLFFKNKTKNFENLEKSSTNKEDKIKLN